MYSAQRDRLFGAGGLWNLKQCSRTDCGLIWLDPMPLSEDIGQAYAAYYTHVPRDASSRAGLVKETYRMMKRGYLANKYGYSLHPTSWLARALGVLLYAFPIRRGGADDDVRFLPALPNGRLLDVGCGSGEWLLTMRGLGWEVEGVDFDDAAVRIGRQRGLMVRFGSVEQQNYPEESFDAIILNHVIEHVPEPVGTLNECRRILKRGGKLVLCTPNSSSLGHRVFKENWRGLEPPRHLHLFSPQSLRRLLGLAAFRNVIIHPQIAPSVVYQSIFLRRGLRGPFQASHRNWSVWSIGRLFSMAELCLLQWNRSVCDCLAAVAVKE
jgi:2-polyprenyl-3-methyl-5-hydroxy-6-metoxy-1,4-benzoquinol methylase